MNQDFPPPPPTTPPSSSPPSPARKRAIWPWFLGGCLLIVLLAVVALGLLGWFGLKMAGSAMSTGMSQTMAKVPGVTEHFGTLSDVSVDWAATTASGGRAMVVDITGSQGKGELRIEVDPINGSFTGASIVLPDGRTLGLDQEQLRQLEDLQNTLPQSQ